MWIYTDIHDKILFGNAVVNCDEENKAYVGCINISDQPIEIESPIVELQPFQEAEQGDQDYFSDNEDQIEDREKRIEEIL